MVYGEGFQEGAGASESLAEVNERELSNRLSRVDMDRFGQDCADEYEELLRLIYSNAYLEEDEQIELHRSCRVLVEKEYGELSDDLRIAYNGASQEVVSFVRVQQASLEDFISTLTRGLEIELGVATNGIIKHISDDEFNFIVQNLWALRPMEDKTAEVHRMRKMEERLTGSANGRKVKASPAELAEWAETAETGAISRPRETKREIYNEGLAEIGRTYKAFFIPDDAAEGTAAIIDAALFGRLDKDLARKRFAARGLSGEDVDVAVDKATKDFKEELAEHWKDPLLLIFYLLPTKVLGPLGSKLTAAGKWIPENQFMIVMKESLGPSILQLAEKFGTSSIVQACKTALSGRLGKTALELVENYGKTGATS